MATSYKVLGQAAPSATTNTDVYTVPSATEAVISTIVIANRSVSDATYRIAVRRNGEAISSKNYVAYNITVGGGDSTALTIGITLSTADVITVQASTDDLSFSVFGSEIS